MLVPVSADIKHLPISISLTGWVVDGLLEEITAVLLSWTVYADTDEESHEIVSECLSSHFM